MGLGLAFRLSIGIGFRIRLGFRVGFWTRLRFGFRFWTRLRFRFELSEKVGGHHDRALFWEKTADEGLQNQGVYRCPSLSEVEGTKAAAQG